MGGDFQLEDSVITRVDTRVSVHVNTVRCSVHVCQKITVTPCTETGVLRLSIAMPEGVRRFCAIQLGGGGGGGGYGLRHKATVCKNGLEHSICIVCLSSN
jgi:hypothetical protein